MTTKLERAVEQLEHNLAQATMGNSVTYTTTETLRTILAALKAQAPSAVQRAERAVVRAVMGCRDVGLLPFKVCVARGRLTNAMRKAKKARRP